LGQTQQVSALFAANVNWTLQMIDEETNAVRTVTGTGTTLSFKWDGTGDGGTNIADGVYYYVIAAQTNGQPGPDVAEGLAGSSPLSFGDNSTQLYAAPADGSGHAVPLCFYPPTLDTNGLIIFEFSGPGAFRASGSPLGIQASLEHLPDCCTRL
jgi:hypothetical protein